MDGDFRAARWNGPPALLNQRVCTIKIRDEGSYDEGFLLYALPGYLNAIHDWTSSTTVKHLSSETIKEIPLPLPPLAEQRRIVAGIDEQISRLDAAERFLKGAAARLDSLRGQLVEGVAGRGNRVRVGDLLSEPLMNGRSVPTRAEGFPVLRLSALREGNVDLRQRKLGAWDKEGAASFLVRRGDFFVARGNGSLRLVGRGGLVSVEPDAVAFPDTLIRVCVDQEQLLPEFLRLIWNSKPVRSQIESVARTTAGIYKINQQDIRGIELHLPDIAEQRRLVAEVERQSSIFDSLARSIAIALSRAARLRQAVLAAAFGGNLVPQDPSDDRASVLLERIAAERAAAPTMRKREKATPA
jgi:type I restriction enzyme S subunit